jgi:2,4-dienoyl-CoA reductase-like NADH-dependent reductase (Old Yellow Enzyme family)
MTEAACGKGQEEAKMASLFQEFRLKDVVLRNRIVVSPMCQYSSDNGFPNDWHFVHLGSRAVGGAGLVMVEASAVTPEGRISPADSGIYLDDHVEPFARISRFLKHHGAVPGIQLAHAGRKASVTKPWEGNHHIDADKGGWDIIAPSAIPFGGNLPKVPREMTAQDIISIQAAFVAAAKRARWQLRQSDSVLAGDVDRRSQGVAGSFSIGSSPVGDGLDRGRRNRR